MLVVFPGASQADHVIDQQFGTTSGTGGTNIVNGSPMGESFTPTLSGIDFATFRFTDFGNQAGTFGTYVVQLHAGINGMLLGTSASVAIPAGFGGLFGASGAPVEFDFSSTLPLTPGSTYSLILARTDASSQFGAIYTGSGYAGGSFISQGNASRATNLIFSEGINVTPVPAPPAVVLVGLGAGCVALKRYVGRRATA
jgi:hypothetical protein